MARVNLVVPFDQKDQAKALGARWDPQQRVWFVPNGVPYEPLSQWMPTAPDWDVRSNRYWVVSGETHCWKCHQPTTVHALAVPPGHEILVSDDEGDRWEPQEYLQFLMYLTEVDDGALAELRKRCPLLGMDYSKTTGSHYWMNHCRHCRMKQGDFSLHCEPGGAFYPTDDAELRRLGFQRVYQPMHACAGTSFSTFLPNYDGWTAC
ncbi:DUF5710 domain-containing protein [Luteibacter sp. 3190]|uniref:DUF5710 domain-containing protein n=1 Tax=Luteibacter sp. 3190 TaxID=2817736 RepID=UPI002857ACFB|nr:DUF5710 domain-containing protein [Luteibacter sp. 3190]MDR6936008.1 hypothetical protein [Luteibacter sp. 3190]